MFFLEKSGDRESIVSTLMCRSGATDMQFRCNGCSDFALIPEKEAPGDELVYLVQGDAMMAKEEFDRL